jgi:hypothetical protein
MCMYVCMYVCMYGYMSHCAAVGLQNVINVRDEKWRAYIE